MPLSLALHSFNRLQCLVNQVEVQVAKLRTKVLYAVAFNANKILKQLQADMMLCTLSQLADRILFKPKVAKDLKEGVCYGKSVCIFHLVQFN